MRVSSYPWPMAANFTRLVPQKVLQVRPLLFRLFSGRPVLSNSYELYPSDGNWGSIQSQGFWVPYLAKTPPKTEKRGHPWAYDASCAPSSLEDVTNPETEPTLLYSAVTYTLIADEICINARLKSINRRDDPEEESPSSQALCRWPRGHFGTFEQGTKDLSRWSFLGSGGSSWDWGKKLVTWPNYTQSLQKQKF